MSAAIHTTYIHTWIKCIDMNNTRVNYKRIVYGVCQVYAQRLADHSVYSALISSLFLHIIPEAYRYIAVTL